MPVKSLIGLISSNSSRRPLSTNHLKESSWSSIRFGIGRTSGIRAYRMRPPATGRRFNDSAVDSMNRSLAEEEGEGRAHRRSRIPQEREMSNGPLRAQLPRPGRRPLGDSAGARCPRPTGARHRAWPPAPATHGGGGRQRSLDKRSTSRRDHRAVAEAIRQRRLALGFSASTRVGSLAPSGDGFSVTTPKVTHDPLVLTKSRARRASTSPGVLGAERRAQPPGSPGGLRHPPGAAVAEAT